MSDPAAALRADILRNLTYEVGRPAHEATEQDWFVATALAVRDRVVDAATESERAGPPEKRVYYFSMEFLVGRRLPDALCNLRLTEIAKEALASLGVDLEHLLRSEPDPSLGNGGLGRLAACFLESMATTGVPAVGYGIRYDYGLFKQSFADGWQREAPDVWLSGRDPWSFERPHLIYPVGFGGSVESHYEDNGVRHVWHPEETVLAAAFDMPVAGWRGRLVNVLRLWQARAAEPLRLEVFNEGRHVDAKAAEARASAISSVLYPSDASPEGHELRLRQEFFFTSASLQDLVATHLKDHGDLSRLPEGAAIQLNDTHPALAVAELMRLLVDVNDVPWDEAWRITTNTLNYTNHTLLPEALETWPVGLLERVLPRHLHIIYRINGQHFEKLAADGRLGSVDLGAISIIDEHGGRRVRMGHLAFLGSRKVNGVSALHTELMRETVFRDLNALYPDRIINETNGISPRRWLLQANPGLTRLLVEVLGERVLDDLGALSDLKAMAGDRALQERIAAERARNKQSLARVIADRIGVRVDTRALFDVQIKRIHEYKRQLLNVLEIAALYHAIRSDPHRNWVPRVKIFGGKAAPSYARAKLIIKLANDVARIVNNDPRVAGRLSVAFLPNYNVSLAEAIIPAADLSEQISTAGLEASGTGNMKLSLNGALTIGTLDGANIEIRDHVGPDNIFIFGMTAPEVAERLRVHDHARHAIDASPSLAMTLDSIAGGHFSPDDPARYVSLVESLRHDDRFMVTADFDAYWATQRQIEDLWREPSAWWRKSILNTAGMAWFSSDRTIRGYARDIWDVR